MYNELLDIQILYEMYECAWQQFNQDMPAPAFPYHIIYYSDQVLNNTVHHAHHLLRFWTSSCSQFLLNYKENHSSQESYKVNNPFSQSIYHGNFMFLFVTILPIFSCKNHAKYDHLVSRLQKISVVHLMFYCSKIVIFFNQLDVSYDITISLIIMHPMQLKLTTS